ncbi:MAG: hypothetical protein K2Q18_12705 [Bdellovibrionales bacterium]|nr:hypothetical protein [Bdellovibrionales bacterium]
MNSENLPYKIPALKSFNKTMDLTTSKSHSNRALILGAVRGNNFKVYNISKSTDVINMISAFKKMGLKMKVDDTSVVFENSFPECEKDIAGDIVELHTGDGGTTNRFLIALLARGKKEYHLFPTEKMSERPIDDLLRPLQKLNVSVERDTSMKPNAPWVKVKGPASLYNTTKLEVDCEKSTQFATALMLAFSNLPLQFEFLNLHASEAYLHMTSLVIKKSLGPNSYTVPVDFSSLGYPTALAAVLGRIHIANCKEIDASQADSVFVDLLSKCGAHVTLTDSGLEVKKGMELKPFSFDVSSAPDLFPTLVFFAAHIEGVTTFKNLGILLFKESDRLAEMISLMNSFGVEMEHNSKEDWLKIKGSSAKVYKSATIKPARDHRIVMAAALFMMKNSGGDLYETDCVEKSFPNFLSLLE